MDSSWLWPSTRPVHCWHDDAVPPGGVHSITAADERRGRAEVFRDEGERRSRLSGRTLGGQITQPTNIEQWAPFHVEVRIARSPIPPNRIIEAAVLVPSAGESSGPSNANRASDATMVASLSEGPRAHRADRVGRLGSRSNEGKPSTVSTSDETGNGDRRG